MQTIAIVMIVAAAAMYLILYWRRSWRGGSCCGTYLHSPSEPKNTNQPQPFISADELTRIAQRVSRNKTAK